MAEGWPKKRRLLGTKVKRLDGPAKATGNAKYSYDINRKGMLHGVMVRSPHPHAKIKSIDTSAARKSPGFKAIVFALPARNWLVVKADADANTLEIKSVPDKKKKEKEIQRTVKLTPNDTILRQNKIVKLADLKVDDVVQVEVEQDVVGRELFYAGDEIAAVAADTEEHAKDAARAIKIEYEILDHLMSEEEVLKNPNKKTVPGASPANLDESVKDATKGDVDAGFKDADVTVEGTYGVPVISHQCLESHGLVAEWHNDGGLTVWASTQATFAVAGPTGLAGRFGLPPTKVNCITHYMGGGFGCKFAPYAEGYAAADLARRAGAPVKIMLDREEEITTAGNRPSAIGTVKIGGKKDGTITAYSVDCYGTPGYTGGATINLNLLPYVYADAIPHWKRSHKITYINAGSARAMRAPGHPQNCVLTEFAVDDLAAKLDLDPLVIRRKHLPPNNPKAADKISWAARRHDIYTEQLNIVEKLSGWKEKWHPPGKGRAGTVRHGIGMALHTWGGFASGQMNECDVVIARDGSVTAETSTQDLGTAQRTVTAIVVAEILGLMPTDIVLKFGESQYGPSSGSGGSTTCPSQAPAALLASQAARDDLFKKVAPKVGADPKNLTIEVGKVVDAKNKKEWPWKEFCARLGMDTATGKGEWNQGLSNQEGNENISSGQVGGVQTAEVLVDSETGVVRVTHMVAVQDCGLVVNKLACESQVAGGVIMGLNYALFEENILDRVTGRQVNPDMEFYKLGGLRDMPRITVHMQDMPDRGVIGIGEPPTISTAAAIGNAVFNALGVRVGFLPLTPKRVLDAIAKGGKK